MIRCLLLAASSLSGIPLLVAGFVSQGIRHPNPKEGGCGLSDVALLGRECNGYYERKDERKEGTPEVVRHVVVRRMS